VFDLIQFSGVPKAGQPLDITLYYDCAGECLADTNITKTFHLAIP